MGTCLQGATIRLLGCPGQSIFGSGTHDLQKSCLTGQVQIISKLTLILSHMLQTSKIILISYKPSTSSNFFWKTYILLFGQVCASSFMAKLARLGNQERKLSQPACLLGLGDITPRDLSWYEILIAITIFENGACGWQYPMMLLSSQWFWLCLPSSVVSIHQLLEV